MKTINYKKEVINKWLSSWKTYSEYVDIETGEKLDKKQIENKDYIITKKYKYVKRAKTGTGGEVRYTNECERNRQGKLPFN